MNRPVLYWVILFILGEVLCRILPISLAGVFLAGIMAGAVPVILFKKNRMIILLGSVFFLLGAARMLYMQECLKFCRMPDGKQVFFEGRVQKREKSGRSNQYIIKSSVIEGKSLSISVILETDQEIILGSVITGTGEVKPFSRASNPGAYDEESYQYGKGDFLSLQNVKIDKKKPVMMPIREWLYQLRKKLAEVYDRVFAIKDSSLAKAMVLGDKEEMDTDIKNLYQRNGIAHLIAISGLHIAMIGGTLYRILRRVSGSYPAAAGAGVFFILLYGIMTGLSGATLRAVIMLILSIGADVSGRRYDMITGIGAALLVMLILNPFQITQVGFLLSFGAVIGIAAVNPAWKQVFENLPHILDGLTVSISVQITLFPILLYFFYEVPVYGVFLNIVVVPVMSLLLALLIGLGITGCFFPNGGCLFAMPAQMIFRLYEQLCIWSERLPFHTVCTGRPSVIWIAVYYGILMVFLIAAGRKKWKAAGFAAVFLCFLMASLYLPGNLKICMFDVGQGDGIYIHTPDRKHILIDGGSSTRQNVGNYVLKNGTKYYGAQVLDYVFVTHSDSDHYSGILELLEDDRVIIKNFVLPAITNPDSAFCSLEKKAQEKGCNIYYIKRGDRLLVGNVEFYCCNPQKRRYEDKNQGSIVLWLAYHNFDMLFTGDMDEGIEKEMVDKRTGSLEVLKVAHHGSATSSGEVFLKRFSPDTACISVGGKNQYGHPAKEVMQRLKKYCKNIYLTKDNGAITIDTDGEKYRIETYIKDCENRYEKH